MICNFVDIYRIGITLCAHGLRPRVAFNIVGKENENTSATVESLLPELRINTHAFESE